MQDVVSQIKALDLREIVRFYGIQLNRNNFANCPFHNEDTPSMQVKKSSFTCYGCNAYGDAIDFVENLFGIDFKDAVDKICNDFGIVRNRIRNRKEKRELSEILELRKVAAQCKKDREEFNRVIYNYYCFEMRMLGKARIDADPPLKRKIDKRLEVLTEILDRSFEDWIALRYFYETDKYNDLSYLKKAKEKINGKHQRNNKKKN